MKTYTMLAYCKVGGPPMRKTRGTQREAVEEANKCRGWAGYAAVYNHQANTAKIVFGDIDFPAFKEAVKVTMLKQCR